MEFLTIRQAARRGPVNENTLRTMEKRGELPGFKNGTRFLVRYDALLEKLDTMSRANAQTVNAQ